MSWKERRCYEVLGYWPPKIVDGKTVHGGKHVGAFVVAANAVRAAGLVDRRYPGVRIDQILNKPYRELLVEADEEETETP